tara:strand:- start:237 stop:1148 length:912 start_codon:yes stop_codon:yes gene_type:complete
MGKIHYKNSTSDGSEKTVYKSTNTRKVNKKVGHKGDYHDINISNQFIKSTKTGSGTSVNPYVYTIDIEDNFVNSISSQKTLSIEMKDKLKLVENLIKEAKRKRYNSNSKNENVIVFKVDLLETITKSEPHSVRVRKRKKGGDNDTEVNANDDVNVHLKTDEILSYIKNDIIAKIKDDSSNMDILVSGFNKDVNINLVKPTLIINHNVKGKGINRTGRHFTKFFKNIANKTSNKIEVQTNGSIGYSDEIPNHTSLKLDVINNGNSFNVLFRDINGIPLTPLAFFTDIVGRYMNEIYIQFYVEYN